MSALSYVVRSIWREPSNRGQRLRRLAAFFVWQGRKRLLHQPLTVRLSNGLRLRAYRDCGVAPAAIYYVWPNSEPIQFLRRHLNGGTLLDVGANIGLVTLLLADRVDHAILFEPNPTAAARARENLALNGLAAAPRSFTVEQLALSNAAGTIRMEDSGGGSPVNRVVAGFDTALPTIEVERLTLDAWLAHHPLPTPLSAIKIDVEGHENAVIAGMAATLRQHRPLVMFEYLQRTDIRETLRLFAEAGFVVFELTDVGPRSADASVEPLQDLFACPEERACELGLDA